jgi:hypothetical protein
MPRVSNKLTADQWLAVRKEAGLKIDSGTAEVMWVYSDIGDPYGVLPSLQEGCIGRVEFARSPDSDIWVCFDDLPDETRTALWKMHSSSLSFPAGLPGVPDYPWLHYGDLSSPADLSDQELLRHALGNHVWIASGVLNVAEREDLTRYHHDVREELRRRWGRRRRIDAG